MSEDKRLYKRRAAYDAKKCSIELFLERQRLAANLAKRDRMLNNIFIESLMKK